MTTYHKAHGRPYVDSTLTSGQMVKAGSSNALEDATNTDAEVSGAVSASHTQGTDQALDTGGANEVTAVNAADAVSKKHSQNTDTGTTSATFQLESGSSGAKLKNDSGTVKLRNAADDADAPITASAGTFSTDVTVMGTTGGYVRKYAEATADITAAHTVTIQTNVPSGSRLLGTQLRVDAALAVGETWNAQYVTGATATIAAAAAVAQNTKVNTMFNASAATDIASDEVDITIQRSSNPGVDAFTAQGTIRAIVYYEAFDAMGDAS